MLMNTKKMKNNFSIGDTVCKKSGKPFKNGSNHQIIVEFGINEQDPNKRLCAIFSDGSICNLGMLSHMYFIDIETNGLLDFKIGYLPNIYKNSNVDKIIGLISPIENEQNIYTKVSYDMEFIKNLVDRE